ncbi:hypothetical protein BDK92_4087 [Micromonospora pisi]|uniref:Uncharacterized protein n=1 Tax=Micromonospora pisi TaxID=589240 RepID=A0A495JLL0_9ACTN|nr:hypothetical protein [Micromonospora pisi]RKR89731.1 hypothetical protein BDK92_4087 [Micromonospora pisi]
MAGAYRQPDRDDWSAAAENGAPADTDAAELIAQIRQLAADADPAGVRQVVAEVLSALDRAAGGALREQLPNGLPGMDGYPESPSGHVTPERGVPDPTKGRSEWEPAGDGWRSAAAEPSAGTAQPPVDLPAGYENAPVDLPTGGEYPELGRAAESDGPPANRLTGDDEPTVALSDLEAGGSEERPTGVA